MTTPKFPAKEIAATFVQRMRDDVAQAHSLKAWMDEHGITQSAWQRDDSRLVLAFSWGEHTLQLPAIAASMGSPDEIREMLEREMRRVTG